MRSRLHVNSAVREILERLREHGHPAYIVGGAVRDLMLGRHPKDFDLATSATPDQIKTVFGRSARLIGRRFRLAHIYHHRSVFEVSTFRREPSAEERTSRESDDGVQIWRDNQYGTLEQDAKRRDFTVNALYFTPLEEPNFIDFCGGEADLKNGVVRAIGDPARRLAEDPVRILRALKLVAEYDFRLAHDLVAPLQAQAGLLAGCSVARLFEELLKVFQKPYSAKTLDVFFHHQALGHFLPTMAATWKTEIGVETRHLLTTRDDRLAAGDYSKSRTLALATAAFAYARQATGARPGTLWDYTPGVERLVRDAVVDFFAPLPVPKVLSARIRDLLLLLSRFRSPNNHNRLLAHPEYRYARELYQILTIVHGWDAELIANWPVMGSGHPHRSQQDDQTPHYRAPRRRRRR